MEDLQKLQNADNKAFQFLSGELKNITDNENEKKKFELVATKGDLIENHWYWGNLVFDLDNIKFAKAKIPSLQEHDVNKRVGYCTSFVVTQEGLIVQGTFLKNKFGKEVSEEAAEDFPWEVSGYFEPSSVEVVTEPTEVNGKMIDASPSNPLTIFKNITTKEVSFCTFGADDGTSAKVFRKQSKSEDSKNESKNQEHEMTELEKANKRIQELESELSAEKQISKDRDTELEKFKAGKRESDIQIAETEKNTKFSDEQREHLLSLSDKDFKFSISLIPSNKEEEKKETGNKKSQQLNPILFTNQADSGRESEDEAVCDMDKKFADWSKK
jgi:hypothetical protein